MHRETVGRYLRPLEPDSKPAIVPIGSRAGRPSQCAPGSEFIGRAVAAGLSAQRVYQELASEHGFTGGYDAVERFVRRLLKTRPPPVRRMETNRARNCKSTSDKDRGSPKIANAAGPIYFGAC